MEFLTGLISEGPLLGLSILLSVLGYIGLAIYFLRKQSFLNIITAMVFSTTSLGIGVMIGMFFMGSLGMIVGLVFYFGALKLSLYMLKKQGNKIVLRESSLGDGDKEYFDWEDEDDN